MVLSSQPGYVEQRALKTSMKRLVCLLKEDTTSETYGLKSLLLNHRCNLISIRVYEMAYRRRLSVLNAWVPERCQRCKCTNQVKSANDTEHSLERLFSAFWMRE